MADKMFRAIADPMRRRILASLSAAPQSVGELTRGLPLTQPGVSQHLKVLFDAELVVVERRGTRRIYALRREGLAPLRAWVERLRDEAVERCAHTDARVKGR